MITLCRVRISEVRLATISTEKNNKSEQNTRTHIIKTARSKKKVACLEASTTGSSASLFFCYLGFAFPVIPLYLCTTSAQIQDPNLGVPLAVRCAMNRPFEGVPTIIINGKYKFRRTADFQKNIDNMLFLYDN